MIFKDPFSSLNPRVKMWKSVAEPMVVRGIGSRREHRDRAAALLDNVGLSTHLIDRYPTNLSGGQLQRAAIASALAYDPCFGTGGVINLLLDIQQERGVSYLFITHDLALAETFAQSVAVMRSGAVVEQAPTAELFSRSRDEYTRTLLNAIPLLPEREAS